MMELVSAAILVNSQAPFEQLSNRSARFRSRQAQLDEGRFDDEP